MDIKVNDVSAGKVSTSPKPVTTSVGRSATAAPKPPQVTEEDYFENSGRLGQVRALIDKLVQAPDMDENRVQRAKALLESGALDSREAADRAALGMFDEAAGA